MQRRSGSGLQKRVCGLLLGHVGTCAQLAFFCLSIALRSNPPVSIVDHEETQATYSCLLCCMLYVICRVQHLSVRLPWQHPLFFQEVA